MSKGPWPDPIHAQFLADKKAGKRSMNRKRREAARQRELALRIMTSRRAPLAGLAAR